MSYQVSITNAIPSEQMYFNGRMTNAWYMFFHRLAKFADLASASDVLELMQLANQQASQAVQSNLAERIEQFEHFSRFIPIPPISEFQPQILPLSPVAFFCPTETLPLSSAQLPEPVCLPSVPVFMNTDPASVPMLTVPNEFLQVIEP